MHFILSFNIMYLKARGWAVQPKYVAWIDNNNKIYISFNVIITQWDKFYQHFYKQCSELSGSTH